MPTHILDRRLNPGQKGLVNRQHFLRRAKKLVQQGVKEGSGKTDIKDILKGGEVKVPITDGIAEPRLTREGGIQNHIFPGNKKFAEGDILPRSSPGSGKQSNPGEGDSTDQFRFVLTHDEFVDLFLEDLELPNLLKRAPAGSEQTKPRRAGYSMSGSPTAMAIPRTFKHSLMRRVALRGAIKEKIEKLEAELLACTDEERGLAIAEELVQCQKRLAQIAFIDPIDIRYRRFEHEPIPIAQAVMFCLMDVSGSMSEHMKDLAKRFYMLLYIFLKRQYKHVEVVFIRHTDRAEEVDENTFFYGPASGGTVVSSAVEEMCRIVKERFSPLEWNIYAAQASDGDNSMSDSAIVAGMMTDAVLPIVQYFAYIEVGEEEPNFGHMGMSLSSMSPLWVTYDELCAEGAQIAMRKVTRRADIFPVFHELFERKGSKHAESA